MTNIAWIIASVPFWVSGVAAFVLYFKDLDWKHFSGDDLVAGLCFMGMSGAFLYIAARLVS